MDCVGGCRTLCVGKALGSFAAHYCRRGVGIIKWGIGHGQMCTETGGRHLPQCPGVLKGGFLPRPEEHALLQHQLTMGAIHIALAWIKTLWGKIVD